MSALDTIDTLRPTLHLLLHLVVPLVLALTLGGDDKRRAFIWMMAAMVIDVDHLLADPIYAPGRCSIGFHPLHQWPAALVFAVMSGMKPTRWFGVGGLVHLGLDALDCWMMTAASSEGIP